MKQCGRCNQVRPLSDFHMRRASKDGRSAKCASCTIEYLTEWRAANPGAFKEWYKENREYRAEYWRVYYEHNKDRRSAAYKVWAKANSHIVNALVAKRNAAKKRAVVPWTNYRAIEAIYAEAARLTAETGIGHEVDHVYPLQGTNVCGLHVDTNLQILTKVENIKKGNRS